MSLEQRFWSWFHQTVSVFFSACLLLSCLVRWTLQFNQWLGCLHILLNWFGIRIEYGAESCSLLGWDDISLWLFSREFDLLCRITQNILSLNEVIYKSFSHLISVWLLVTNRVKLRNESPSNRIKFMWCWSSWSIRSNYDSVFLLTVCLCYCWRSEILLAWIVVFCLQRLLRSKLLKRTFNTHSLTESSFACRLGLGTKHSSVLLHFSNIR